MKKLFILIADDEVAYGKILKNTLLEKGYKAVAVLNGDELLKIVRVDPPDLIVLDLVMPVINGFQVLKIMKNDKNLEDIKIIALSNLVQNDSIEEVRQFGVTECLIKSDEGFYEVIDKIERHIHSTDFI